MQALSIAAGRALLLALVASLVSCPLRSVSGQVVPWAQQKPVNFPFLHPPPVADVIAFSNSPLMQGSTGDVLLKLQKEKVREFLTDAAALPDNEITRRHFENFGPFAAPFSPPDRMPPIPHQSWLVNGALMQWENSLGPNGRAEGIVATKNGGIYFWRLETDQLLHLQTESGAACLLVLWRGGKIRTASTLSFWITGNFENGFPKLKPPRADDVIAFANFPEHFPESWSQRVVFMYPAEEILHFLKAGQPRFDLDQSAQYDLRKTDPMPVPPRISENTKAEMERLHTEVQTDPRESALAQGVMTTKNGPVYFWVRLSGRNLLLLNEKYEQCAFALPAQAESETSREQLSR